MSDTTDKSERVPCANPKCGNYTAPKDERYRTWCRMACVNSEEAARVIVYPHPKALWWGR